MKDTLKKEILDTHERWALTEPDRTLDPQIRQRALTGLFFDLTRRDFFEPTR